MMKAANRNAPARFAARTTDQFRARANRLRLLGSLQIGRTGVIVFSVKSCKRPSTTMMNPTV